MRKALSRLGRLVAGLSPQRIEFDRTSADVVFVVNRAELTQVFPWALRFYPCQYQPSNAPHSFIHVQQMLYKIIK